MEFAGNLRRLRKAAGYTQEALAEKLHLTGQAVSRWETGDGYPEITLLPTLADLLGVTVDALLRPAALKKEEVWEIVNQAIRTQQEGNWREAVSLLETQLELHPEASDLLDHLAYVLLMAGRQLAMEGKTSEAAALFRRAESAAEKLRSSGSVMARYRAESILPEICYRLGEKEKLAELRRITIDPVLSSLSNCVSGKDRIYVFEKAVFDMLFHLDVILGALVAKPMCPAEPEEPLIYEPFPGEGEWELNDADRYEIEAFRAELLEWLSPGEGLGEFRWLESHALTSMLALAADMGQREKTLSALERFTDRFASRELLDWERRRVLAADRFRLLRSQEIQKGSPQPEAAAAALLRPEDLVLVTEPLSPLPVMKHLSLGRVWMRDPPLLPGKLLDTWQRLRERRYDFVREDARFRAAEETLHALLKELEAAGQLPVKRFEEL